MIIHSHIKDYSLTIVPDFSAISSLLGNALAFYVVDQKVYNLYPELFSSIEKDRLFLLNALEREKTIDTALRICEQMTTIRAKRNVRLVSFGGGITQDITGFAANVLYRGVHWTFVPTTLLAACDSCIGGKTSLNYKGYKNLLGTFYPPEEILICSRFFQTLSEDDYLSGLGEVAKFNFLMGEAGAVELENKLEALLQRDMQTLSHFVESSLIYKKSYIEEDEFDNGVRVYLNFAHTFGHAIETASEFSIPHGTAVAMGMIVANRVSVLRNLLSEKSALRIERTLIKIIPLLAFRANLEPERLIAAIKNDKKQIGNEITAVLMDEQYKLSLVHNVKLHEVNASFSYLLNEVGT